MGDCHYLYGNVMTLKRIGLLKELIGFWGMGGRLQLEWISSAEAKRFVQVVTSFTERIRDLGPSPLALFNRKIRTMVPGSQHGSARSPI
jgi:F420-non-reducing hydrogenase iron-sulfur subunit